jgi:hypothetical protein
MTTATAKTKSVEKLASMGVKRAKNDRSWDWLKDIAKCVKNYMRAPAVILPMISNDELTATVYEQGNAEALNGHIQLLTRDVQTYTERLQALYGRHSQRNGSSVDPDDLMNAINLSQDYRAFMASYEMVVMPTILDILAIMEKAGVDTSSVRAIADSGLVYNLWNQESTPSPV